MAGLPLLSSTKALFIRAFLVELGLGDVKTAALFARAFLAEERPQVQMITEDLSAPLLVN